MIIGDVSGEINEMINHNATITSFETENKIIHLYSEKKILLIVGQKKYNVDYFIA